jgi:hypothetical protein
MFCFSFLAYGEEHIGEFNIVAESLLKMNPNFKIVVATDSPEKIINGVYRIVKIEEEFNYNLKRIVIEEAMMEFNTIMFLDTDIFIRSNPDFSILDTIDDGIYSVEVVDLNRLKDVYGSLEYMRDYLNELETIYSEKLFLVHEGLFVLKISNTKQKENFIKYWKEIDIKTRPYHKLAYGLPGAMEGLIIWIAIKKSEIDLKMVSGELSILCSFINHFGTTNRKMKKTLI